MEKLFYISDVYIHFDYETEHIRFYVVGRGKEGFRAYRVNDGKVFLNRQIRLANKSNGRIGNNNVYLFSIWNNCERKFFENNIRKIEFPRLRIQSSQSGIYKCVSVEDLAAYEKDFNTCVDKLNKTSSEQEVEESYNEIFRI